VVDDGAVQEESSGAIAGRPIALPMLAVHTVGAGGGSIAWRDPGGALRVGPQSAGADPGPACYRRGGTEPTVTDANLVLGYLASDAPLAGSVELDRDAAEAAIGRLADQLGLGLPACAEGIRRVANAEMLRALRVVTVQRGVDPRGYALLAFGGAGPLHAAQIAEELEIARIVCPRASGVLAALGLVVSERRRDVQRSVLLSGDALSGETIARTVERIGAEARKALGASDSNLDVVYELRYRGQAFELAIPGSATAQPDELREAFEAEHEERYGYRDPEQTLELVTIRLSATAEGVELELAADDEEGEIPRERRAATMGGEEIELEVLRGAPAPGVRIVGPSVVELPEATLLVAPGWAGEVDRTGSIDLRRAR
jgi:N-methylhydantoinase A